MTDNNLFSEFEGVTLKQWKQKIQVDLKGKDFNKTLVAKTNDQINIQPIYNNESAKTVKTSPSKFDFKATQSFFLIDVKKSNKDLIYAFENGISSFFIEVNSPFDYNELTNELDISKLDIHFCCRFLEVEFLQYLMKQNVKVSIDIIHNFEKSGRWFLNQKNDFLNLQKALDFGVELMVDTAHYQNAGTNKIQQIAYGLLHLTEYLNTCSIKSKNIHILVSVGTNYFFEIAKLKALRTLIKVILNKFAISSEINIISKPSLRNKTIYDYNVNLLRTTSECMSAILGGSNYVANANYNEVFNDSMDFSNRIAKNQLLILREESNFKNANTFVNGTYYIENLTNEMMEKSLHLYKEIERKGGLIVQLKEGTIQKKIEESAKKEQEQFNANELILVGTNKFQNKEDKMKGEIKISPNKKTSKKVEIKKISVKRLAEQLENSRLKQE